MPGATADRESAKAGGLPSAAFPATGSKLVLTWSNWREALRVVMHGPHLRKTTLIALLVGSVLFAINHLDVVLRGQATPEVWIKGALTYLVPFFVSNIGILVGTRRPQAR